jgi:hypothetical protein
VGAALLLAGTPALASAADAQIGPIQINDVQTYGGGSTEDETVMTPMTAEISFTNEYSSPGTEVVFALFSKDAEVAQIDDVGSFAKGVSINHTFADSTAPGDLRVAVVKATFADGTTWQNPNVPDEREPAIVGGVQATDSN